MTRPPAALTAVALLATLALGACADKNTPEAPEPAIQAPAEAPDRPDCDAEDRRNKETDCGFRVKGVFYEYSWVKAGKTEAPSGWSAAAEKRAVTTRRTARK